MSESMSNAAFAVVAMTMIAGLIVCISKWFELQTAKIKRDTALIEKAATGTTKGNSDTGKSRPQKGLFWYVWKRDKSGFIIWVVLVLTPLAWGMVFPVVTPGYIWMVGYISPLAYVLAYLILQEAAAARYADKISN